MRLLRPYVPIKVRLDVIGRQLLAAGCNVGTRGDGETLLELLERRLVAFANVCRCLRRDLRLDHHPALENREKEFIRGRHSGYIPNANDPDCLRYMIHRDHDIKTRVRGERGQFADNVIAKRERRRNRPCRRCRQHDRIPGKALCKRCMKVAEKYAAKLPKRKIQSRNDLRRP